MALRVFKLFDVIVGPAKSQVRLFENVHLKRLVGSDEDPLPNVELPPVFTFRPLFSEEQRSLDVLLNHFRSLLLLKEEVYDVLLLVEAENTESSRVVAGLANPNIVCSVDSAVLREVFVEGS